MSNIDKRAREKLKAAAAKAVDNFDPNMFVETRDVLALLNEIAELEQRHCGTALLEREEMHTKTLGRMLDELEESERLRFKFQEANCELCQKLEAAEKRIAELEALARVVKQFSEFQICHYGATEDYAKGYIDCQNNYNKVLFAAAGKGEES